MERQDQHDDNRAGRRRRFYRNDGNSHGRTSHHQQHIPGMRSRSLPTAYSTLGAAEEAVDNDFHLEYFPLDRCRYSIRTLRLHHRNIRTMAAMLLDTCRHFRHRRILYHHNAMRHSVFSRSTGAGRYKDRDRRRQQLGGIQGICKEDGIQESCHLGSRIDQPDGLYREICSP